MKTAISKRFLCVALALVLCLGVVGAHGIVPKVNAAEEGKVYTKVTDVAELTEGAKVIIATSEGEFAMTDQNGSYRNKMNISANADGSITGKADMAEITISKSGNNYVLNLDGGVLCYTGGKNVLYTSDPSTLSDPKMGEWTISIDQGVATITNAYDTQRNIKYNASSPRFSTYTTAQVAISLYKVTDEVKVTETVDTEGKYISFTEGSLELSDMLHIRYYVQLPETFTPNESNCGIIWWTANPGEELNTGTKIEGFLTSGDNKSYGSTGGIVAADINKMQYIRAYVVIEGVTYYTPVLEYGVANYLATVKADPNYGEESKLYKTVEALIAYGTAAADLFG